MTTLYRDRAPRVKNRFAYRSLPYGVGYAGDVLTLFDRKYQPIARCCGKGPLVHTIEAHDQERRPCVIALPIGTVTACDRSERIEFRAPVFFYHDGTSPRHNAATRARLLRLVAAITQDDE
jgi:hypothetical protein